MKSILLKPHLVDQTFAGNKTQTRRVIKPQPQEHHWSFLPSYKLEAKLLQCSDGLHLRVQHSIHSNTQVEDNWRKVKYNVGETIYVKEKLHKGLHGEVLYTDDQFILNDNVEDHGETVCKWPWNRKVLSPLFMPEWAARLFLRITNVRVERLQDISEDDAKAEGVEALFDNAFGDDFYRNYSEPNGRHYLNCAKDSFETLWDSINGKDESKNWNSNPWVFVYEFKMVEHP